MNSEWKQLYNGIIDSCATLLQTVDDIQGKETGRKINDIERKKLEKMYRNIRAKVNNDKTEFTYADILFLGNCAVMAQVCNKNLLNKATKTVDFFSKDILPQFDEYKAMTEDEAIIAFSEKMNNPII